MTYYNKLKIIWLCAVFVLLGVACGRDEQPENGTTYKIFYINNEETKTVTGDYVSATQDTAGLIEELLGQLAQVPSRLEYKPPLASGFELLGYTLDNGQLTMNFDGRYREMDNIKEVLTRADRGNRLCVVYGAGRDADRQQRRHDRHDVAGYVYRQCG